MEQEDEGGSERHEENGKGGLKGVYREGGGRGGNTLKGV